MIVNRRNPEILRNMGNIWATWFLRFPQQPIKRLPDSQSDPDSHTQRRLLLPG